MQRNLKLLHVCHSQGAIQTKNALEGLPEEIQDRIIVVAVAPAAIVPKRLCFKSYNYASEKDIVYKFDPGPPLPLEMGMADDVMVPRFGEPLLGREELIILPAHPEAKGIDHEFQSPTYEPLLKKVLADYDKHKGEYLSEEKGE